MVWFWKGGSVKDRPARYMIIEALKNGTLKPGAPVIEATSGNTGIGVALTCQSLGIRSIFCIIANKSPEKINLLRTLGAEVILCKVGAKMDDPEHYHNVARATAQKLGGIFLNQYFNENNWKSHLETGNEIWNDTQGKIDVFVTTPGTGGTLGGVSVALKEKNPNIEIIAVEHGSQIWYDEIEPSQVTDHKLTLRLKTTEEKQNNTILNRNNNKTTVLEGVVADTLFPGLIASKVDRFLTVLDDRVALLMAYYLVKKEGIMIGGSAALNVAACYIACHRYGWIGSGKTIVTVLCDNGERYMSSIFNEQWRQSKGFFIHSEESDTLKFLDDFVEKENRSQQKEQEEAKREQI